MREGEEGRIVGGRGERGSNVFVKRLGFRITGSLGGLAGGGG